MGMIRTMATLNGKPITMQRPIDQIPAGKTVVSIERGFVIDLGGQTHQFNLTIEFDPPLASAAPIHPEDANG